MLARPASTVASEVLPYCAHTPEVRAEMLKTIGVKSVDDLFVDIPRLYGNKLSELIKFF